jgi:hypothetical protein
MLSGHGWEARFKHEEMDGKLWYETLPIVLWMENDGVAYGMVLDAANGLRSAKSFQNFSGYQQSEDADARYVPAATGWWVVSKITNDERGWWERVIAWRVSAEGWTVQAVGSLSESGPAAYDPADTIFVFDTERTEESIGPWPSQTDTEPTPSPTPNLPKNPESDNDPLPIETA